MADVGLLRQFMTRLSSGFVIALHDMPPERLARFVDDMWPARPIPLAELVERRKAGKPGSGLFAITVDDGVGYNVRALARLLRVRGWPATFYLPTHYLDTGEPMAFQWWWRLKPLLPHRKLQLPSGEMDLSLPGAIENLSKTVERMWYCQRMECYLPLTMELVSAVANDIGITKADLQGPAPISWPEVERLSRDDLFQFESHTVSHTALFALDEQEIDFEMRQSRDVVEQHTGRPCRHLCYPFGTPQSIGSLAPKVARRYYDSATTMTLGSVDHADPWTLPRIPLYPKNSLLFARLKLMLKCTGLNRVRNGHGSTTQTGGSSIGAAEGGA